MFQAVRSGGLAAFKRVVAEQESIFIKDGNIDLVQRLHHNVVRAGLRKICASYSAISLVSCSLCAVLLAECVRLGREDHFVFA